VIAEYFTEIYKRPDHMQVDLNMGAPEDDEMVDEMINTTALFSLDDIREATNSRTSTRDSDLTALMVTFSARMSSLSEKVMSEIAEALNNATIPDYLRVGRLVPLQKTFTKGPCALDEIRPIVVRSHLSKIMEKAILERIKTQFPHLIASKVYQTGFKEGKSTAIHASRLLNEAHGVRKRKFNLLVDLQKAYDSVDRVILWKLLKQRC
jgi:hypothetical protein